MVGTPASWPPLMPRLSHLGSASDTRSRAGMRARPKLLAGYSPDLPGHVPPVDFCNRMDPQAQPRPLQTPPLTAMASHRTVGSVAPGEAPPAELSRFRGRRAALAPPRLPRRPPAPTWIYPKPIDPDTFCRSLMPLTPWKSALATTGRKPIPPTTPFETLGGSACRARHAPKNAARLEGPPRTVARESNCPWPHPRCLPPQRPLCHPTAAFPLPPS
jgi:hypothetical protein